jgi:hypothetical protein
MDPPQTKSISYNTDDKLLRKQEIKKYAKEKEKNKKRVETEKWSFSPDHYNYDNQLNMMKDIYANQYVFTDNVSKIAIQQINRKIYGYRQQDLIKKMFNQSEFITLESIINKMVECDLKCYYCSCEMNVLYDISREMKQWTVDRINNDLGHNLTNYYLACLECNLKRRRRSDDKFLFTKQMKLVKLPRENIENEGNDTSLV